MGNPTDGAKEVFLDALDIDAPDERRAFLDRACGDDGSLRAEVEALLEYHRRIGSFLTQAPQDPIATASHVATADDGPGTVIGPYRLMEQIGEGGFGLVFVAEQQQPIRRRLALKVIKPGMDTREVVARFEAERQALALMDHPNIARVFDGGATPSGRPFFVMELVKGVPITQSCDDHRLTPRDRLRLFADLCSAVQHAHQKGVIHRDLKPTNVLVTSHDGTPVVKVIDFGVAKAVGQSLTDKTVYTGFAQMVGTPLYMSPEQAGSSGLDVDTRSDIYSLGVLLYELLSGTTPFDKERLRELGYDEIRRIIREEEPAKPSTRITTLGQAASTVSANRGTDPHNLRRMIRGELDWIVMKALEKDRNRRYESASAFAADINRYLNDEPVQACPPSMRYRLRKFLRRNRGPVLAGSIVIFALFGGSIGASYGWLEAGKQREVTRLLQQTESERDAAKVARGEAEVARDGEKAAKLLAENAREKLAAVEYGRAMQLAHQAWRDNDMPTALALLDSTREDLRGWEWHYVNHLCNSELLAIKGHTEKVSQVAFSPDESRVLTASGDRTARIWDVKTGADPLVIKGHTGEVLSAAFSNDGSRVITGSEDRTARIWDAKTGAEILVIKGHTAGVVSVSFSPDGSQVLTGSADRTARIWDSRTAKELRSLNQHNGKVNSASFNMDGSQIVTASEDYTVRVWDVKNGVTSRALTGHTGPVKAAKFSRDGDRVVSGSEDKTAKVWDAKDGKELLTMKGHTYTVWSASFSPDGISVLTGGDTTARIWDAKTGIERHVIKGHTSDVLSAAFDADGSRVLTGSWDRTAKIWDVKTKVEVLSLNADTDVNSATFSSDGLSVLTGDDDKLATVWDAKTGTKSYIVEGHARGVTSASFNADGSKVLTSGDTTARLWDAKSRMGIIVCKGHTLGVGTARFSADESRVVTGSGDRTARVWDAKTGVELLVLRGHTNVVASAAFSHDGSRVVTGCYDRTAKVWDARTGAELITCRLHRLPILSASFSADGSRVLTGSADKTAKLWNAESGDEILTFKGHTDVVSSVSFSPDGSRVLTAGWDKTVKLWDAKTGAELLTLKGHTGVVNSASFSADGLSIVTAGDTTARIWVAPTAP